MYFLLGISLSLAFLLVINFLVALLASGIWGILKPRTRSLSARLRGQIIFGLRVMPVVAALVFVCVFVVPAYVLYEPSSSGEVVSGKLLVIAIASSLGVAFAFFMVYRTWLATRRLTSNWLEGARELPTADRKVPVYQIDHDFPVVAVVGIFRPRLFVATKVVKSLTPHEFAATLAHEYGHLISRDNLKRTLLRICRDLLVLPIGKGLDSAWSESAESVADEYAARSRGGTSALDLASALIKIAKLVPPGGLPSMPVRASLIAGEYGEIAARVQNLLSITQAASPHEPEGWSAFSPTLWICSLTLVVLAILSFTDLPVWSSVHLASEHFVKTLQ